MAEPTSPQEEFNLHREQAERNGIEPMSYREGERVGHAKLLKIHGNLYELMWDEKRGE